MSFEKYFLALGPKIYENFLRFLEENRGLHVEETKPSSESLSNFFSKPKQCIIILNNLEISYKSILPLIQILTPYL